MPAGFFQLRPIISMLSNVVQCYPMLSNDIPCYQMLSHVIQCYPMLSNDIQCYLMISNHTIVAKDERNDMGSLPGAESLHDHFF